jgi:acetyl-CoA/propionyl-CoA carboxylase biotin carboxyl carrier protein
VAAGEALPPELLMPPLRGHAIEVRLYAEDPWAGFRPMAGQVGAWRMPDGPGVRVDAGVQAGTPLAGEYDPLLAKLLVHAEDRPSAVARLRRALDETLIGGVQTDAGFLRWLVDAPDFVDGAYDTGLVADRWGDGVPLDAEDAPLIAAAARLAREGSAPDARGPSAGTPARHPADSAWARRGREEGLRG